MISRTTFRPSDAPSGVSPDAGRAVVSTLRRRRVIGEAVALGLGAEATVESWEALDPPDADVTSFVVAYQGVRGRFYLDEAIPGGGRQDPISSVLLLPTGPVRFNAFVAPDMGLAVGHAIEGLAHEIRESFAWALDPAADAHRDAVTVHTTAAAVWVNQGGFEPDRADPLGTTFGPEQVLAWLRAIDHATGVLVHFGQLEGAPGRAGDASVADNRDFVLDRTTQPDLVAELYRMLDNPHIHPRLAADPWRAAVVQRALQLAGDPGRPDGIPAQLRTLIDLATTAVAHPTFPPDAVDTLIDDLVDRVGQARHLFEATEMQAIMNRLEVLHLDQYGIRGEHRPWRRHWRSHAAQPRSDQARSQRPDPPAVSANVGRPGAVESASDAAGDVERLTSAGEGVIAALRALIERTRSALVDPAYSSDHVRQLLERCFRRAEEAREAVGDTKVLLEVMTRLSQLQRDAGAAPRTHRPVAGTASESIADALAGDSVRNVPPSTDRERRSQGGASYHASLEGLEALVHAVESGIVATPSVQPTQYQVPAYFVLVTFNNGSQAFRKSLPAEFGEHYRRKVADAEQLAAVVGQALGAPVPGVYRTDEFTVYIEFVEGMTYAEYRHLAADAAVADLETFTTQDDSLTLPQMADSDTGRLLGLLDVLVANLERGDLNTMITPSGTVAGADQGTAWELRLEWGDDLSPLPPQPLRSVYVRHFLELPNQRGETVRWAPVNDMSTRDIERIRARLNALYEDFELLGRVTWWQDMMARFNEIARRARGTHDRLPPDE
jgi:hypothetical protein